MHLFIKKRSYLLMVDDDTNCNNITFSSECVKLEAHKISTITIRTKQWSLGPGLGNLKVQIFGRNLLGLYWLMKFQPSICVSFFNWNVVQLPFCKSYYI